MGRVSVSTTVPGRAAEAQALWHDPARWPAWVDGFSHVVRLDYAWPQAGACVVRESRPGGRGRVLERVRAYAHATGQTLEVEDERLRGIQEVRFEAAGDVTRVTVSLGYALKRRTPLTPLVDWLFV